MNTIDLDIDKINIDLNENLLQVIMTHYDVNELRNELRDLKGWKINEELTQDMDLVIENTHPLGDYHISIESGMDIDVKWNRYDADALLEIGSQTQLHCEFNSVNNNIHDNISCT